MSSPTRPARCCRDRGSPPGSSASSESSTTSRPTARDTANKIGTYSLALAARRAGIPFVVAAPESTIDEATATGADIPLELRADEEVTSFQGTLAAPRGTRALNYAFDVTPADLITAIVTEDRVIRP